MKRCLPLPAGTLRPSRPDDLEAVLSLFQDDQVSQTLFGGESADRARVIGLQEESDRLDNQGLGIWVIESRSPETTAGIVGLQPVPDAPEPLLEMIGGVELIIALFPAYWGQGLAAEACRAVLNYAHDNLGLVAIFASVDQPNARSHRLLQKLGFRILDNQRAEESRLVHYQRSSASAEERK
ncbi:MAG: GNAT family N-acetyltransferase [Magnetovibrionaceae bacterium]